MSGDLGSAIFELKTDSSKFDTGVDQAEAKTGKLSKTLGAAGVAGRILGGIVTSSVVGALSDAANAGAEEEASLVRVMTAVDNTGLSYAAQAANITAVIDKGKELGFHNKELNDSFALLVEQTGSAEEATKRMAVAENLARGAHIDLYSASKLLGKATDENANVLGRYGIHVEKGADVTKMLGEVQAKFGGQAEAYGATTSGAIDRTKVAVEGWQAAIGNSLPAQTFIALLPGISSGMTLAGGAVGLMSAAVKGPLIASFLASVPATIAMMAPFAPLVLAIAAIGAAALALKWAWDNNFGDIQGKTQAVFDFLGGAFEAIKGTISAVWGAIGPVLQGGLNAILAPIQTVIGVVQGALSLLGQLSGARSAAAANNSQSANLAAFSRGYASGTDWVPATGLYKLHEGEAVLTAQENADRLSGGGRAAAPVEIPIYLDGREIARAIGEYNTRRTSLIGLTVG